MSDLIDRAEAQTEIQLAARRYTVAHEAHGEGMVVWSDDLISVADAMNALRKVPSAQPCTTACTTTCTTTDTISRQAAIDAVNSLTYPSSLMDVKYKLEALPSAQPKRTQERTETHSCDLISRAMLLEYIHNEPVGKMLCDKYNLDGVIKQFPSAQPERVWTPCDIPPEHHRDVIVRGIEAIGNVTVHKVMQWDVDTWRPTDYAPSVMWKEWSEI